MGIRSPMGGMRRRLRSCWCRDVRHVKKQGSRLRGDEIARYLARCPGELCDIVLALRGFVLKNAPEADESIKFGALCYAMPNAAYGAIGGNVCLIDFRKGQVTLGFLHGASLPDRSGLLLGTAKSKRFLIIRTVADARRRAVGALIKAAISVARRNVR